MRAGLILFIALALALALGAGCPSLGTLYRDRGELTVRNDLPYIEDNTSAHRLDLYEPASADADTRVVVFVHGGYWNSQDKGFYEAVTGLYGNVGVALAREGFRVANINYRLFPEVQLDGMVDDVAAAVDFVAERFPAAPLTLMGHSAGAHIAAFTTHKPHALSDRSKHAERVTSSVLVSGVYDIQNAADNYDAQARAEIFDPLFGAAEELKDEASMVDNLVDGMIPTLFVVGKDDLNGCRLDFATADAQVTDEAVVFLQLDDADHQETALEIGTETDRITPAIVDFLRP
ncbi:MAG: alpha/beta hydrolase [Deltaproteobacteria bacterium]|nr:alpha/beta hydrolase [Deltaproteobacteria bacterium]